MRIFVVVVHALAGLFVEDGAFALTIIAVVAIAGACTALLPNGAWASGFILLLGCLVTLLVNVILARPRGG